MGPPWLGPPWLGPPWLGPPWLSLEKRFQNGGSQMPKKRCFEIGFNKCSISYSAPTPPRNPKIPKISGNLS